MNISIAGTGYLDLLTGECLAEPGSKVFFPDGETTQVKEQ